MFQSIVVPTLVAAAACFTTVAISHAVIHLAKKVIK